MDGIKDFYESSPHCFSLQSVAQQLKVSRKLYAFAVDHSVYW